MHFMRIIIIVSLGCSKALASLNAHTFVPDGVIQPPLNDESSDKKMAEDYLQSLISKHGARIQQEEASFREKRHIQQRELVDLKDTESKLWHVGEIQIHKVDDTIFGSIARKLRELWPKPMNWQSGWHLSDLSLFILSVGDSDIFDNP